MDFGLPATFGLGPSRNHTYRALQGPEAWAYLLPRLGEPASWQVALKLSAPPAAARLAELAQPGGPVHLWSMEPKTGGARVATCVLTTYSSDWHVAVLHEGPLGQSRHLEGIEALSSAVFRAVPSAEEVWTALPLPEPPGAEEALVALNFTHAPSDLDGDVQKTYGLFRYIWTAYHSA